MTFQEWMGSYFSACFSVFVGLTIRDAITNRTSAQEDGDAPLPLWLSAVFIVGGLAAIVLGGNLVVENASKNRRFLWSQPDPHRTYHCGYGNLTAGACNLHCCLQKRGKTGWLLAMSLAPIFFNILMVLGVFFCHQPD